MAKTLTEAAVTTRNARAKLPPGIHWRGIDPNTHLGYRKGKRAGVWLVRWRAGKGYRQAPLGAADDQVSTGLSYDAAAKAAVAKVEGARKEAKAVGDGTLLSVRSVVEDYIALRDRRESRRKDRLVHSDAHARLSKYVLSADVADVPLHALSEDNLARWRKGLPEELKSSTRQRLVNDFRAALNGGYGNHRQKLDPALPGIIKHGFKADADDGDESEPLARENQILSDADITRLIRSAREIDTEQDWDGDLFRLVIVLASTGARFSQVARMKVGDCQHAQGRLLVPMSRKGKSRRTGSTPVQVDRDVLNALLPAVTGRPADAPLLERWQHTQVGGGPAGLQWKRSKRGPWQKSELTRPWQEIRKRAGMPEVIPYALRHSSIVRGIRANLPIRLVASIHDTSVAMIERYYSKWIVDGLEELAARAVVPLLPPDESNVIDMSRSRA